MEKYIALLRGINVGGKNKISMSALKEAMTQHGFGDVSTYINSGNIIFSSKNTNQQTLKNECEMLIARHFQLAITVMIIAVRDLEAALDHAPPWWDRDESAKHNAIFVIPPTTVAEVYESVGDIKPDYEKVAYHQNVVFWSAPIETFSRTRWSKVVGSSIYDRITIRNANTTKKLLLLAKS